MKRVYVKPAIKLISIEPISILATTWQSNETGAKGNQYDDWDDEETPDDYGSGFGGGYY